MTKLFSETRPSDALTPVAAYAALRAHAGDGASFLFESVVGGERWGRYSILGYRPRYEVVHGWDGISVEGALPEGRELADAGDPLDRIAPLLAPVGPAKTPAERFASGHVGFFAWDLVHRIEAVPPGDPIVWKRHFLPLFRILGGLVVVVFDNLSQTYTVSADDPARVARALSDLETRVPLRPIDLPDRSRVPEHRVDVDDATFCARVREAQELIRAGDAFQVVLARTFQCDARGRDAFDVYRAMRLVNPSPYMYFLDLPPAEGEATRTQIAGASPETLIRTEDGKVTVRPIAGTRPRGKTETADLEAERELLADEKERAEHVMLVDLGRNDVGRVSELGTVTITKQMVTERYSHVMHIVSEVSGTLRADASPVDVVRAGFPAGTLSGAPKVRAMQIIRELEARPRNIYGGAIGYVAGSGEVDLAIAIRTAVCRNGVFEISAGAGVVDASVPESEAEETRSKARGVLAAIAAVPERA
jgi:anthranilate synthase component 1